MTARVIDDRRLKAYRGEDEETDDAQDSSMQQTLRDEARSRCMRALQSGLSGSRAWTQRDIREFLKDNLSDRALSLAGIVHHDDQLRAILDNESKIVPQIIEKIRRMEPEFRLRIDDAKSKGWIGRQSAENWIARLEDDKAPWWKKNDFLTNKFPEYYKNWQKLHEDKERVLQICKTHHIQPSSIPEIAVLVAHGFIETSFTFRRGAVDKALAAIAAHTTNRKALYDQAKKILTDAAADNALSKAKIGTWLRRIFESGADPKKIEEFVKGKGKSPLPILIERWKKASLDFDTLQKRVTKEGKPPSFGFISKKKFLEMHYESRLAYLQEAEYRMKDIELSSIHPLLLDIRRELDAEDWESAEVLLTRARGMKLNPEESEKVSSMDQYLRTHRSQQKKGANGKEMDPHEELNILIHQLPAEVQPLFRGAAMRGEGVLRCLKSLWYNRKWVREHGYLDDHKEEVLRQRSKTDTRRVLRHGHGKGYENMSTEYGQPAIRRYRGEWAPTVLHYQAGEHEHLLSVMEKEKDNYAFKYWSTLIPKSVDYGTHVYVLQELFPKMMNCVRRIDEQRSGRKAAA